MTVPQNRKISPLFWLIGCIVLAGAAWLALSQLSLGVSPVAIQQPVMAVSTIRLRGNVYDAQNFRSVDLSGLVITAEQISKAATNLVPPDHGSGGGLVQVELATGIVVMAEIVRSDFCLSDPEDYTSQRFAFRWAEYEVCLDDFDSPESLLKDFLNWLGFKNF